jgi:hypothetical protein
LFTEKTFGKMLRIMKVYQLLSAFFIYTLLALSATNVFSLNPHRYHTTLTRIDFNPEQKTFEISIQLFKHDLEPLLERKYKTRIDFEKTQGIDALILNYLNEEFVLTDKAGKTKHLKWVGREMDVDTIWIYLETDTTETPEGYSLRNTLFFESFPEQSNLVICRYEGKKADLMFKVGDKVKKITSLK